MSWRTRLSIDYSTYHQLLFPILTQQNKKYQSTLILDLSKDFCNKNFDIWRKKSKAMITNLSTWNPGPFCCKKWRQQYFLERARKQRFAWGVNSKASICLFTDQKSLSWALTSLLFLDRNRKRGQDTKASHFWTFRSHTAQQNYKSLTDRWAHMSFLYHLVSLLSNLG